MLKKKWHPKKVEARKRKKMCLTDTVAAIGSFGGDGNSGHF